MTATQFIHLESYGIAPRRGQPKWANIEGILLEAGRAPGAVAHLTNPLSPEILFGAPPAQLIEEAERLARSALDAMGRHLRRDGSTLVAGVASYPGTVESLRGNPVEQDIYRHWRTETLSWLVKRFGPALRSVVEHEDEQYLHLHFFLLPSIGPQGCVDWTDAHPGLAAKRLGAKEGKGKKDQDCIYRGAMRAFQDEYFRDVSRFMGQDRYGPRRERVSRRERKAQIRLETERARMLEELRVAEHERLLNAELEARHAVQMQMMAMMTALEEAQRELREARERADAAENEIRRLRAHSDEMGGTAFDDVNTSIPQRD